MSDWLNVPEALRYLRVGRTTLYRWLREGRLRYYTPEGGGHRRLKRSELDAFMRPGSRWQDLVTLNFAAATLLDHQMKKEVGDGVTMAVYRCERCGLDFVIGHPPGGSALTASGPALTTPCPGRRQA